MVYGYPCRDERGFLNFGGLNLSSLTVIGYRIHKNGKQVAVYLATTKNRLLGISKIVLIHRYNTTSLYVPRSEKRERELQWSFIITTRNQSLERTLIKYKDY